MSMTDKKISAERRKFFRFDTEKVIHYKKVFFADDKMVSFKTREVISKNLSTSGILFRTIQPPQLSSMVLLRLDLREVPNYREIKEQVFMVHHKILGKVVRVYDHEGQYEVGVAFVTPSEDLAKNIRTIVEKVKKQRFKGYFLKMASVVFIIMATLVLNLIYLQRKDTYRPDQEISLTPASVGIHFEEVNFKSLNGKKNLNGWFVPAKNAEATILFCHGREGNMSSELDTTHFFHSMSMNFFIFDYRGYGKSLGWPSEKGLCDDAKAAYDYLVSRDDIHKEKIIVIGESLGGTVATDLCLHRTARALVLESTFVSLVEEAHDLYPGLPVQYFLLEKYDTLSHIKYIHIPKLIVHGVHDEVVPFKHAKILYDAASFPKQFLSFEGGHSDGVFKSSEAYKSELKNFLEKNKIL